MKKELILVYLFLVVLNYFYGIKRNRMILGYQHQIVSDRYYIQRTKIAHLISIGMLVFLIVIIAMNTDNPDYVTYKWMYESGANVERGWGLLEKIALTIGLQYDGFKTLIVAISFILTLIGLIKLNINENIIFALYAFYPFAMDAIQLRNFLAASIIVFSYFSHSLTFPALTVMINS